MLNREKYAKEIVDVALKDETFALMDGNICACSDVQGCTSCAFYDSDDCIISKQEWANSEYVEPPVDWSKVAVDTPILVRDSEEEAWRKDICKIRERNSVRMECRINVLERVRE